MIKVLIVDDDKCLRELLASHFTSNFQMTVAQSTSGNEAIKRLQSGEKFSVIISDYNMPDGNGADLQKYLVQTDTRSLFLFFSSEKDITADPEHHFYLGAIQKTDFKSLVTEAIMGICTAPNLYQRMKLKQTQRVITTPL